MPTDELHPPLHDLAKALREVEPWLSAAAGARGATYVNHEGGDVGGHSTERSLFRHVANYLAVAELGERCGVSDSLLDVGSGTGALAAWVAARLGAELHLVDPDPAVRSVALAAFPHVSVHAELDEVPRRTVGLVAAMEVVEHIPPSDQGAFVEALFARVEPGGLLVLSTPDESGYVGGWSGYAPHVGPVDARRLRDLLSRATGSPVRVWRMEGDAFASGPVRRVLQPLANRTWTRLSPALGPVASRLARPAAAVADLARRHAGPDLVPAVRAVAPDRGRGTGLLAVVRAT